MSSEWCLLYKCYDAGSPFLCNVKSRPSSSTLEELSFRTLLPWEGRSEKDHLNSQFRRNIDMGQESIHPFLIFLFIFQERVTTYCLSSRCQASISMRTLCEPLLRASSEVEDRTSRRDRNCSCPSKMIRHRVFNAITLTALNVTHAKIGVSTCAGSAYRYVLEYAVGKRREV